MKHIVSMTLLVFVSLSVWAQPSIDGTVIPVCTDKTLSLVFPRSIRHFDLGSANVVAQQVGNAENLLLVKASQPDFGETSLTVVTADGGLYAFRVLYEPHPSQLIHRVGPFPEIQPLLFTGELMNSRELELYCTGLLRNKQSIHGIRDARWYVGAQVEGIYVKEKVIFYQLKLVNWSVIDYDVDFIRFYIRDRKKGKRTASQEVEIKPLYVAGNLETIAGMSRQMAAVALPKFTIPNGKYLAIEIMERNGGRHLKLQVNNRKLMKAKQLK
jgi:conjugative transposon TraN protein